MRLAVLDVGSNTVHLLVVDASVGAHPDPAFKHRLDLRLAQNLEDDGRISQQGADLLVNFCRESMQLAQEQQVDDLLAFATSAIRDATNGPEVIERVRTEAGVELEVLPGEDEARMTFLAIRRWFGWSSGRLQLIDIGGGSLELAIGRDEEPDLALSLQLGAGRLTRDFFGPAGLLTTGPPADPTKVRELREYVRETLLEPTRRMRELGPPDRVVGSSKTMRSLGRIAGAAPSGQGDYVARSLSRADLEGILYRIATMDHEQLATLPGVSPERSGQLLAGAVVAQSAMELLGVEHLDIAPWALREGLILRRLDHLEGSA